MAPHQARKLNTLFIFCDVGQGSLFTLIYWFVFADFFVTGHWGWADTAIFLYWRLPICQLFWVADTDTADTEKCVDMSIFSIPASAHPYLTSPLQFIDVFIDAYICDFRSQP